MGENDPVKTIWIGTEFVSIGDARIHHSEKGSEVMFRKFGALPIIDKFNPTLANVKEIEYQERNLYIPGVGDTGTKVRIYFSDLRGDKYYSQIPMSHIAVIAHLKRQNETLKMSLEKVWGLLLDLSNDDRFKKAIKDNADFWSQVKGWGMGGFGGMGGLGSMYPPIGPHNSLGGGDGGSSFDEGTNYNI